MTFQIGVPRSRRDILAIPCPERFDGNKLDELPYSIVLASHRAVALLPESIHRPGITLAERTDLLASLVPIGSGRRALPLRFRN